MPTEYILNADQETALAALESGKYKQIEGSLTYRGCFCCLGVFCIALGLTVSDIEGVDTHLGLNSKTEEVQKKLKLYDGEGSSSEQFALMDSLAGLNDGKGLTLKQIAAVIRKNPSVYFHE